MNIVRQRQILERRLQDLREHIERVGSSPGFEAAVQRAEAELAQIEQPGGKPP